MRSLLFSLLLLSLFSCSPSKPVDDTAARGEATRIGDSLRRVLKTQRLYYLEIAADSMLDDFDARTFPDFALGYLHRHWAGISRQKKNVLVAFTDINGRFALVSCLANENEYFHHRIVVVTGNDSLEARSSYGGMFFCSDEELHADSIPRGGEAVLFDAINSLPMGKVIALNVNQVIRVKTFYLDDLIETYELTPENKEAIAATYRLSLNYHEQSALRRELTSRSTSQ